MGESSRAVLLFVEIISCYTTPVELHSMNVKWPALSRLVLFRVVSCRLPDGSATSTVNTSPISSILHTCARFSFSQAANSGRFGLFVNTCCLLCPVSCISQPTVLYCTYIHPPTHPIFPSSIPQPPFLISSTISSIISSITHHTSYQADQTRPDQTRPEQSRAKQSKAKQHAKSLFIPHLI